MTSTVQLGRLRGIPLGAHWSLLVIGGLLTLTLATGLLPATVDASPVAYWSAAAAGAFLFFGSILAHEMAHAVVAQHYGLVVDGITLWILGGVARLRSDARTPRSQLAIALAGPAASFVAAALFLAAALGLDAVGLAGVAAVTLAWLALVNGVLAVFNLLPGAPLDGGRVLAALLWMRHGDRTRAFVSAAQAGRVLGWLLVGLGLANVVLGVGFGSLWTALIGWFIVGASRAEHQAALLKGTLDHLTVQEVMDPHPAVAPEWITVGEALRTGFGRRPVVLLARFEQGDIGGIATLEAARRVPRSQLDQVRLSDIAIPKTELVTAAPGDPAAPLLPLAADQPVVVLDAGQVVGVVTLDDIAHLLDSSPPAPGAAHASTP